MNRRKFLALTGASFVAATLPVMASEVDISGKIHSMLMKYWFESNDESTRNAVLEETKDVLHSSGIHDYVVCCDESNNPPNVIENNMLVVNVKYHNKDMEYAMGSQSENFEDLF